MSADDTRDRVIRLETRVEHLEATLDRATQKIDEMHNVLMQAKGAKWVILAAASVGGFVAGISAKFLPFLTGR